MKDQFKKVTQAFNQHVKPTTLENEFIPNNGFKQGDKVKVKGCFSDFKKEYEHLWFEGEFFIMCSRLSKWKYRVKVNGKYSDWNQCEKL